MTGKRNGVELPDLLAPIEKSLGEVRLAIQDYLFRKDEFEHLLVETADKANWGINGRQVPDWLLKLIPLIADQLDPVPADPLSPVHAMTDHLLSHGGKMLRASLVLTVAEAFNPGNPKAIYLASALELIHLATLLHDDVIDHAELRRGAPSMWMVFNNAPTVLMGDHVFASAFDMLTVCGDASIISEACQAASGMCRGEIEQLQWIRREEIPATVYFRLIERKTAGLMGTCARTAAILSGVREPEIHQGWYRFGLHLGLAFQMMDDLLDFTAEQNRLGKKVGNDLEEGKYTLPMILLRDRLGGVTALREFLGKQPGRDEIIKLLESYGVFNEVRSRIDDLSSSCHNSLDELGGHCRVEYITLLHRIIDFITHREY